MCILYDQMQLILVFHILPEFTVRNVLEKKNIFTESLCIPILLAVLYIKPCLVGCLVSHPSPDL